MKNDSLDLSKLYESLGESIVLFQRLEGMLKLIISRLHVEFDENENSNLVEREIKLSKQTLGNLSKRFVEQAFVDKEHDDSKYFTVSITFDTSENFINCAQQKLEKITATRNMLIHELFSHYDFSDVKEIGALMKELKYFKKEINEGISQLGQMLDRMSYGFNTLAEKIEEEK